MSTAGLKEQIILAESPSSYVFVIPPKPEDVDIEKADPMMFIWN